MGSAQKKRHREKRVQTEPQQEILEEAKKGMQPGIVEVWANGPSSLSLGKKCRCWGVCYVKQDMEKMDLRSDPVNCCSYVLNLHLGHINDLQPVQENHNYLKKAMGDKLVLTNRQPSNLKQHYKNTFAIWRTHAGIRSTKGELAIITILTHFL